MENIKETIKTKVQTTILIEVKKWEHIEIYNTSEQPDIWRAAYIDYDQNTGAVALFQTKEQALENWETWLPLAKNAYQEKWAKHGDMPVFTWTGEKFNLAFDDGLTLGVYREYDEF